MPVEKDFTRDKYSMRNVVTIRFLLIISCIIGGLLSGGNLYRYVIEVPAWRHLDISDWSAYSKHADLGNGLFLFPVEAFGSALPLLIASAMCLKNRNLKPIAPSLHVSTSFALAGLALTFFAAPIMLHLPKIAGNITLLHQAFDRFHFWGSLRAIAQILSFLCCVVVVSNMYKLNIPGTEFKNLTKTVSYET
jgi:hypothetical protein